MITDSMKMFWFDWYRYTLWHTKLKFIEPENSMFFFWFGFFLTKNVEVSRSWTNFMVEFTPKHSLRVRIGPYSWYIVYCKQICAQSYIYNILYNIQYIQSIFVLSIQLELEENSHLLKSINFVVKNIHAYKQYENYSKLKHSMVMMKMIRKRWGHSVKEVEREIESRG